MRRRPPRPTPFPYPTLSRSPNVAVVSAATGQNSAGPTTAQTDASGQAQFCYTGTHAGSDTISAFADLNSNTAQDTGEPARKATVTFANYADPKRPRLNSSDGTTSCAHLCVKNNSHDDYQNLNP